MPKRHSYQLRIVDVNFPYAGVLCSPSYCVYISTIFVLREDVFGDLVYRLIRIIEILTHLEKWTL